MNMNRLLITISSSFILWLGACHSGGVDVPEKSAPGSAVKHNEITQDERMGWWREARFGLFIHWGLYAIPAGEWGKDKDHGEWIRESAHIPVAEYEKFQPQWNPVKFDADAWATAAHDAGMRYLVITSKHHDGFDLFDSAVSEWDVMNTPFHRDVLKELSEACARHGVRFCTYHSIMDWHHPDYLPRRSWEGDTRPVDGADFERFEKYLHAQVSEVITKYHPGVLWFDGEWESTWTHERGLALYELCRKLDPKLIINNRVDVHRSGMGGFSESSEAVGDFSTPEQEIPATGMNGVDWETCMTMNDHWGWNKNDKHWKSSLDLVRMLIDIASKGGNYLLNVGPRPDGTFPPEALERMHALGAWLATNGEAIYGTSASPFDALGWGRCTQKSAAGDTLLYLHVFDWPKDGRLVLPGLGNEAREAHLLADPKVRLDVARAGDALAIALPSRAPDAVASVIALRIAGKPIVYRAPKITAPAKSFVHSLQVALEAAPGLDVRVTTDGSEPTASSKSYSGPLTLDHSAHVKARAFHQGRAVSAVVDEAFERVSPRAALSLGGTKPGLECRAYPGDFDRLPDFAKLSPASTETIATVSLGKPRKEYEARTLKGFLAVPRDEVWSFGLTSDDGSRFFVDGALVIDHDGLHGTSEKRGELALAAGPHAIEVQWFNKTGGAELGLRWGLPGANLEAVPASALSH